MSDAAFYRWNDVTLETVTDSIERRLITGDRLMLAHVLIARGGVVPRHRHENEQLTFIIDGALRFWFGEDEATELVVHPGEVLYIPSNVWHKAEAVKDTLDMDIFSPPRQDWLDHTDSYFHNRPDAPPVPPPAEPFDTAAAASHAAPGNGAAAPDSEVTTLYRWDKLTRERVTDKLERNVIIGERVMLARVFLAAGCVVPGHAHMHEQFSYVLEGSIQFQVGDDQAPIQEVRAGEVLHLPSHVWHRAETVADAVLLDVFSPPREDWLVQTIARLGGGRG